MEPFFFQNLHILFLKDSPYFRKRTKVLESVEGPEAHGARSPDNRLPQDVWRAQREMPARLQEASHLAYGFFRRRRVLDAFRAKDDVERFRRKVLR